MSTLEQRGLMRRRYRERQMLQSADLRREIHDESELQWWHNRALHAAYGIVDGLDVAFVTTRDPLRVVVAGGLAYDAYGRPIRVLGELSIGPPPPSNASILVLRSTDTDGRPDRPLRVGSARYRGSGAELCWADPARFAPREGVALACLTAVRLGTLPAEVDFESPSRLAHAASTSRLYAIGRLTDADRATAAERSQDAAYVHAIGDLYTASQSCVWPRASRAMARRRIVSGTTQPADTPWRPWSLIFPMAGYQRRRGRGSLELSIGFEVGIDTTSAGFSGVPEYFAWLQGPLFGDVESSASGGVHWDHIEDATADGFTFRTCVLARDIMPGPESMSGTARNPLAGPWSRVLRILREGGFFISWLAIERCDDDTVAVKP